MIRKVKVYFSFYNSVFMFIGAMGNKMHDVILKFTLSFRIAWLGL